METDLGSLRVEGVETPEVVDAAEVNRDAAELTELAVIETEEDVTPALVVAKATIPDVIELVVGAGEVELTTVLFVGKRFHTGSGPKKKIQVNAYTSKEAAM